MTLPSHPVVSPSRHQTAHTVILNWNDQTPLVLQNLAKGKRLVPDDPFYQRPVTVLANKAKAEMDAALKGLDLEVDGSS